MRKKRMGSLLLCVIMAVTMFSGCGNQNGITGKTEKDGKISISMYMWDRSMFKELYQLAKNNTQRRYKGRVSNMLEIMGEIISSDSDNLDPDMVDAFFEMDSVYEDNMMPMFVATNSKKVNGAGVILYDGLLRTFAEKIGGDFYILPSSVHEVIFVPANGDMDARYLIQMVKEVNATEVSPDEVLSDNVYMYHADTDFVEMM